MVNVHVNRIVSTVAMLSIVNICCYTVVSPVALNIVTDVVDVVTVVCCVT